MENSKKIAKKITTFYTTPKPNTSFSFTYIMSDFFENKDFPYGRKFMRKHACKKIESCQKRQLKRFEKS